MRKIAIALLLLVALTAAGDNISYHGLQPVWTFYGGNYKGTWFHVEDFIPSAAGFTVEWVEIWLMELDDLNREDGLPVLEIWNEDLSVLLGESEVTGSEVWFSPAVETGEDFWCILNTEQCSEPVYILTDDCPDGHSFYSDDWLVWEEYSLGEFFISACNINEELSCTSWGELKATF